MQNLHYASKDSEPSLKIDVRIEFRLGIQGDAMKDVRFSMSHGYMGRC